MEYHLHASISGGAGSDANEKKTHAVVNMIALVLLPDIIVVITNALESPKGREGREGRQRVRKGGRKGGAGWGKRDR